METRGNPFTFEAGRRRASSWVFPNAARGNGLVVADSPTQTPGPEAASAQRTRGKSAVERIDIPTTTSATTSASSPGEADRGPISPGHFAIFHFARAPEPRNPIRGLTMATCRAARGKYRQSPRRAAHSRTGEGEGGRKALSIAICIDCIPAFPRARNHLWTKLT